MTNIISIKKIEGVEVTTRRASKLYPLILAREYRYPSGNTSREMRRNREYDGRWYAAALPRLYARQVSKYHTWYRATHKGKFPLALPYGIDDVFVSDEVEAEYIRWDTWKNPGWDWKPGNKAAVAVSGEDILQAELEGG